MNPERLGPPASLTEVARRVEDRLQGMLQAKSAMWHVLEQLAPHLPAVDAAEMHALRQRTGDQQREVQRITSATLEGRFLAG